MRRHCMLLVIIGLLTALAVPTSGPVDPAGAATASRATATTLSEHRVPVWPGLDRRELSLRLDDDSPAVADVLAFDPSESGLELRPRLAHDRIQNVTPVPEMGRRLLDSGGVAGINASFFTGAPPGDPDGFYSEDALLESEASTQGEGPRGAMAVLPSGELLMDRFDTIQTITFGEDLEEPLTGVNRYHTDRGPHPDGSEPVYLYSPRFGEAVEVRPLTEGAPVRALVLDQVTPPASGTATGTVAAVHETGTVLTVPEQASVAVAHGAAAERLSGVGPGESATVRVAVQPAQDEAAAWAGMAHGLTGGPLILKNGQVTDPDAWFDEGFSPRHHTHRRHPRSAIGWTAEGEVLLVTVDGRQPEHSVGMTMNELADLLRELGAVRGLALDGGGSTQMAVDGQLVNRACCDTPLRGVATGLFVHHDTDFVSTSRLAGSGREATAAAIARESHPEGANQVALARADDFPDALAGGPLVTAADTPLLLSRRDELSEPTAEALSRLDPEKVVLLGGPAAISDDVADRLASDYRVERIAGAHRVATAAEIAEAMDTSHPRVFLAVADDFPDALSASAPGGMLGMPILLSRTDELPTRTREALERFDVEEVVVLGGTAAISDEVVSELRTTGVDVSRLAGRSRYGTAQALQDWTAEQAADGGLPLLGEPSGGLDASGLVVALGQRFPDALAGGPLAARRRQLLAIVPADDVRAAPEAGRALDGRAAQGLESVTLLGGHAALSSYQQWQLEQLTGQ